jgi:hypothetical protein
MGRAAMFLIIYIAVFIFTVATFSFAAKINTMSNQWIKDSKPKCKRKLERRMRKSLMPLKLYFGNNFVDGLTPLVIQDFCARQTASLLLVTK